MSLLHNEKHTFEQINHFDPMYSHIYLPVIFYFWTIFPAWANLHLSPSWLSLEMERGLCFSLAPSSLNVNVSICII